MALMNRKAKLEKLKKISKTESKNTKWKEIAKWNQDHTESLEDYMIIASRISQSLKAKGMTQKELEKKLEVSPQALTRIMKGRQNLTLQSIRKIEKALDITLIAVHRHEPSMIFNMSQE